MVEAAYVGNLGRHLLRAPDINQATFAALIANAALPAAQRASVNALRPYQGYSAINMRLSDATSNYHSMQTIRDEEGGQPAAYRKLHVVEGADGRQRRRRQSRKLSGPALQLRAGDV